MWNSFYRSLAPYILVTSLVALPFLVFGAYSAIQSNENVVTDWLPPHFAETRDLKWFIGRFGTTEMLAVSWQGCTLEDPRVAKLAESMRKLKVETASGEADLFREVFTGTEVLETLTSAPFNLKERRALLRLRGWLVGSDGKLTCVVARLSRSAGRLRHHAIDMVYELAKSECGIAREELRVAGPSTDSVAIDRTSLETIETLNVLCWSVCLLMASLSFGSLRVGGMVFVVALVCQFLSLSIVYYTGTTMNSILMMVGSLVFVLSVSASVHLVNYYRDAIASTGMDGAPVEAVRLGWVPCWLAAGTTSIGMASLMVSRIKPIFTFGEYAAIGVLAGLVFLMMVLPSWLTLRPMVAWSNRSERVSQQTFEEDGRWSRWAKVVMWLHGPIVILGVGFLVFAGFGVSRLKTTVNLHDMFRHDAQVIKDYNWMQENIGPMVPVEVVIHIPNANEARMLDRMRLVEEIRREVAKVEEVGGTITAATFGPKVSYGGSVLDVVRRTVANRKLEKHREEFKDNKFLYDDGDEELWRISVRVKAQTRIDYGLFLDDLEATLKPVIEKHEQASRGITGVQATLCGGVPLVNKAQKQLLEDLIWSFCTAFVLVGIAMVIVLRDLVGGLLSMLPNVIPAIFVFGFMGWADIVIDIGAMMTASAALGIAVDDTLHFVVWFRRALECGLSRRQAVLSAFQRCGNAMIQTSVICGFGLLVYSLSPFVPISRFGWIMCLMLFTALLGDLIFLPALLAGPLGRFFELKTKDPVSRDAIQVAPANTPAS
ncbi:MAG: hypothetical protein CMJ62_08715 [Planctomycetaceae bacterium]|nr:hypothetical protein [Planctomycetaceae bacterium]